MSLTISLDQQTMDALVAEASSRAISCEQVVSEMLESYFSPAFSPNAEYDAWFRAKVEEGREAIKHGDFCSHEDVQKDMDERRAKLLARVEEK